MLAIGKKYLVPTINNVAILLPAHSDRDLCIKGGELEHYHYDWRFQTGEPDLQSAIAARNHSVTYKKLKCVRAEHPRHPGFLFALWQLMCRYRWSRLNECRGCPHRGIEVAENQCPGHGLVWDKSGQLKHRNCQLYFRITGTDNFTEVGWVFHDFVNIMIIEKCEITNVSFEADGEVLGQLDMKHQEAIEGDTLEVNGNCD